jgi:hypothetical protein
MEADTTAVGIARTKGCGRKYTKSVIVIAIRRYNTSPRGVGRSMSSDESLSALSGSSRLAIAFSVVIGFTVLVVGGVAFLLGNQLLGETLVLLGVFLFAFTLICWIAARRRKRQ